MREGEWQRRRKQLRAPSPGHFFPGLLQVHGNLIQFADMIKYITGKNAVLNYNGYGCHCGVGGKGAPKDETDR